MTPIATTTLPSHQLLEQHYHHTNRFDTCQSDSNITAITMTLIATATITVTPAAMTALTPFAIPT